MTTIEEYCMQDVISADALINKVQTAAQLLGPGWYMNSTMCDSLALWHDSRGRVRTEGRVRYMGGTPYVQVCVKCEYKIRGWAYTSWAYHDTPMTHAQIPTNRQKRNEMVRNITALRTITFGENKPRSKREQR